MNPVAIVDPRIPSEIIRNLKCSGFSVIAAPRTDLVDTPISGHPDIQMFLHKKNLFVHPDIDISFLKKIEKYINIIHCSTKLNNTYPEDIPYNIACAGSVALHRKGSTDETILGYLFKNNIAVADTRQGYSKCSTLIVDENSVITSDRSIQFAAEESGLDTICITQGYVDLPGYNYGFIGGASGKFLDTIYLTGSIDNHPDRDRIMNFIESKGMKIKMLSEQRIVDTGSIFFIE